MFIDETKIFVKAGKGGDGSVSFRHEKYVPMGGPDGGDGGNGGDIIIKATDQASDLSDFNRLRKFKAEDGQNGMGQKMHGKNGEDLILPVPIGTQIFDSESKLIADLVLECDQFIPAKGGNGGWGNIHFHSSIKQAPKWAKKGLPGGSMDLGLELKMIADVGLIGLPNAGKSTLLSVISNARPKIANYPFTTLEPNLGVIKGIDKNIIVADIPGLIEGASKGKGLGDKFLKHIERTKTLVHVIDAMSDDVVCDYKTIRNELKEFSEKLENKNEIVVLNKIDVISSEDLAKKIKDLKKIGVIVRPISAATSSGTIELIKIMLSELNHPNKVKDSSGNTLKAGGIVVAEENGQKYILLIHVSNRESYAFPKGHLEQGENAKKAAIREIKEETGVDVSGGKVLPDHKYSNDMNPKGIICKMFLFRLDKRTEIAQDQNEEESFWVPMDEVKDKFYYQNLKDYYDLISKELK